MVFKLVNHQAERLKEDAIMLCMISKKKELRIDLQKVK